VSILAGGEGLGLLDGDDDTKLRCGGVDGGVDVDVDGKRGTTHCRVSSF